MSIEWPSPKDIPGLSDHQRAEVKKAFRTPLAILTGGPGTGKTFSTASILKACQEANPRGILMFTPSGKAAVRLTESIQSHGLSLAATTAHRMLIPTRNGHDYQGWAFQHNEWNPLPAQVLVGDEMSMVDTSLMADILAATAPPVRILMVGDPYQLPPVGPGKPFIDLIDSGWFGHGHLTEIHRFAGRIAYVCRAIQQRKPWDPSPELDWQRDEHPENLKHLHAKNSRVSVSAIEQIVHRLIDRGFKPHDFQVVTAVNRKSAVSRHELNPRMQEILNPNGRSAEGNPFRQGDKVICRRNQMLPTEGGDTEIYVANGEMGTVTEVHPKRFVADFAGEQCRVTKSCWQDFHLGYVITVHSSQGSQWPVVIVIIDDYSGAKFVANRAFYYTALSRASKLCILVGKREVMERHMRGKATDDRCTFLAKDMRNDLAEGTEGI